MNNYGVKILHIYFSSSSLFIYSPAFHSLSLDVAGGLATPNNSCNWLGSWYDDVVNAVSFTAALWTIRSSSISYSLRLVVNLSHTQYISLYSYLSKKPSVFDIYGLPDVKKVSSKKFLDSSSTSEIKLT